MGRATEVEWLARGAAQECDYKIEVYNENTIVTVEPLLESTGGGFQSYSWIPDTAVFRDFQDNNAWMNISCTDDSYWSMSSPFVLTMTAAPTSAPSRPPTPAPSPTPTTTPSSSPTPLPTTPLPTQMHTLHPTPLPSFSPTPYATTLIVPQGGPP